MSKGISGLMLVVVLTGTAGCGGGGPGDYPDMGTVYGTVTMDGKPLANATISFTPEGHSRMSTGATNEDGEYELSYSIDVKGAKTGTHSVKISTRKFAGPNDEGDWSPGTPESVPNKYNSQTTLAEKVEGGSNSIDFELDSQGEVDVHEVEENPDE